MEKSLTERKKYRLYKEARYKYKDSYREPRNAAVAHRFLIHRSAIVALLSRADDRIPRRDDVRCHAGLDLVFREERWDFLERKKIVKSSRTMFAKFSKLRHRSMKRAKTLGHYCLAYKLHPRKLQ